MYTGSSDIFRLLLQSGASTYECNSRGHTTDVITAIWDDFARAYSSMCELRGISTEKMQNFEHCGAITQLALAIGCMTDRVDDQYVGAGPLVLLVGLNTREAHASALVNAIKLSILH